METLLLKSPLLVIFKRLFLYKYFSSSDHGCGKPEDLHLYLRCLGLNKYHLSKQASFDQVLYNSDPHAIFIYIYFF